MCHHSRLVPQVRLGAELGTPLKSGCATTGTDPGAPHAAEAADLLCGQAVAQRVHARGADKNVAWRQQPAEALAGSCAATGAVLRRDRSPLREG